jgi:hypothetical protein
MAKPQSECGRQEMPHRFESLENALLVRDHNIYKQYYLSRRCRSPLYTKDKTFFSECSKSNFLEKILTENFGAALGLGVPYMVHRLGLGLPYMVT